MLSIDEAKRAKTANLRYRLRNADVYVSAEGYHFTDYLDETEAINSVVESANVSDDEIRYIEHSLQSNAARFAKQVALVRRFIALQGLKILDVGAGGGFFLSLIKKEGGDVEGVELSDSRAFYAHDKYAVAITKRPLEDVGYWASRYNQFEVVTFWDVIEHVNYPQATVEAAAQLLGDDGLIFIDTPCRDTFYHRVGEMTYRLSSGRFPTFLNIMYSSHPFGHKQIFSVDEMKQLLARAGFGVLYVEKFHELSFPIDYYLSKLLRSEALAKIAAPAVRLVLRIVRIRNKMVLVARKRVMAERPLSGSEE